MHVYANGLYMSVMQTKLHMLCWEVYNTFVKFRAIVFVLMMKAFVIYFELSNSILIAL